MNFLNWTNGVMSKMFTNEIKKKFNADIQLSSTMESWIQTFHNITSGKPPWNDPKDDIESINFAGFIDDVTAGLVTLDLGIEMPDTPRGQYLQKQADYVLQVINDKVSEGLGNCGIMFKPNGQNVDYIEPGNFAPTETDSNGNILGCVFQSQITRGDYTYTRLEWHRFEGVTDADGQEMRVYRITNQAFRARKPAGSTINTENIGDECNLTEVPEWANLAPDMALQGVERPLFAYFKNPAPNRIDRTSPLGVPIWHNCLKELKDLDIAWGRKSGEVADSKHITFADESVIQSANNRGVTLARFVKGINMGANAIDSTPIHEHVATMLTEQRIADINSILALISTKCGFSQGFFVLDEKTGVVTATQIESDDQETIRTIKNIRGKLKNAFENLFYALNVFADIYTDLPATSWEDLKEKIVFDFADITDNFEEERTAWWKYRLQGDVPPWMYYVKFEGMSEDEAKAMVEEAKPDKEAGLFREE